MVEPPFHSIGYTIASVGAMAAGLLFKARIGERLTWGERGVLSLALVIWGLVAYASLLMFFPSHDHTHQGVALLAIPLGVGYSELFAILIISLQVIIQHLPEEFDNFINKRYGGRK